jgi:hypothetical protein
MKHFLITFSAVLGAIAVAGAIYIALDAYGKHQMLMEARRNACDRQGLRSPADHFYKMKQLGFPADEKTENGVYILSSAGDMYGVQTVVGRYMDKVCKSNN